ncbi:MAG: hypothetical protein KatS3mg076_1900 [Candidatus Binatia bacterium]|nr:MAG: hypothetical protein KatS3mg076_1900 [Candidatus Binatia bacterium]
MVSFRSVVAGRRPVRFATLSFAWLFFLSSLASTVFAETGAGLRPLPGAEPFPPELEARLLAELRSKGPNYVPRTRHRNPDGSPRYTNRLLLEKSPYLLQHAHNPVNWYPWGPEAFEVARRENRPVLLSVGYSTCHWCHVMEEESFEDEEIAEFLNRHYVAIKVDRERRPDVDAAYMAAVQALSGGGGWPMTVWLTPSGEPFYGGTYFPPRDGARGRRPGFLTLLRRLHEVYRTRPEDVRRAASDLVRHLEQRVRQESVLATTDVEGVLEKALEWYRRRFDAENGGFGTAPKFPRPAALEFLLRMGRRTGDPAVLRLATRTLEKMAAGGIRDAIGGGFHRYSTDSRWRIPHFEKMLYDNAQLVVAYLEAYQATGREEFARVARDTLRYLDREMSHPEGGFYSATDADSEGEEGKFYLWSRDEVLAALGPKTAGWFVEFYGIDAAGELGGKNVLYETRPLEQFARERGVSPGELRRELDRARALLYEKRKARTPPLTDRKVVLSWNALAVSAFARAALVLGEPEWARRAARAAEFLRVGLRGADGLRRVYFEGHAEGRGFLDDYAFLVQAWLDLYEATFDVGWLEEALELQKLQDEKFWDAGHGGYFFTPHDGEKLPVREKPVYDGAEPSGNSVAFSNLLRLSEFTTKARFRSRAEELLAAFSRHLERAPADSPKFLSGIDFLLERPKEIVLVRPDEKTSLEPFLSVLRRTFFPNRVLASVVEGKDEDRIAEAIPWVAGKPARRGRTTAYVCEEGVCELPTTDPEVFEAQLAGRDKRARSRAAPALLDTKG